MPTSHSKTKIIINNRKQTQEMNKDAIDCEMDFLKNTSFNACYKFLPAFFYCWISLLITASELYGGGIDHEIRKTRATMMMIMLLAVAFNFMEFNENELERKKIFSIIIAVCASVLNLPFSSMELCSLFQSE